MATCKECLHYEICHKRKNSISLDPMKCGYKCPDFKNKADVVEVKHGYWHLLDDCANEGVYCSVCNKKVYKTNYANQKIKSPYCPNCGAKMDLKE